ncbi:MAG: HAD-IB family phosphatase [Dehalococcoidia bacterium]|nr:HAD-IB family phosphatase [Dehalococcoidia bacterium]
MTVVASDLEGTLTTGETWQGMRRYLAAHGRAGDYRRFALPKTVEVIAARLGLVPKQAFRDRWVAHFIGLFAGVSRADLDAVSEWVVERELWPKRRQTVVDELRRHVADGARLILASATYQPVLDAFARRLGAVALGSPVAFDAADRATGALAGPVNSFRQKAARLAEALDGDILAFAYGDTLADMPMLEMARTPVVVWPDTALARVAKQRGWRLLL